MFGGNQQQQAGTTPSMFGGAQQQQQQQQTGATSAFGGQQQQTGTTSSLFGGPATTTATQPAQSTGLFGQPATQTQAKPAFGLGASTTGGSFFNSTQQPLQQQQQQPAKPSLDVFRNPGTTQTAQPSLLGQSTATGTVVQGVKVDISNLLPTTKYESCSDELRKEIEAIDNAILGQMKLCHEVADILPTIESQGASIPNDVDFVQGKLETMQHALENDANEIDQLRSLVTRDAAEAQVAFRAIDTLKLPLQYQTTGGGGWWSQDQKVADRSLRSTRKNTLALPDDVEGDPATVKSVNGVPVNLVDYFSQRSDEMGSVLDRYKGNLKEIEDHLHGVELSLNRQINEFVSKSRDGASAGTPKSVVNDLAAVLGDVEAGIMGVAARLGGVSEQVQEMTLGPLSVESRYGY
jgi:nucleoporin p58/p45